MDILIIENASPPKQPSPAQSHSPGITLDPNSPVTPNTWIAGKTYPIVIKGTGFIVSDEAGPNGCPKTEVKASVKTGSVDLTEVEVRDSTTITAKVKPAATDPTEKATIVLYEGDEGDNCTNEIAGPGPTITAQILAPKLYIMDPYLFSSASSDTISDSSVFSTLPGNSKYAAGLITDGTSTGIAVFGPVDPDKDVTFTVNNGATLDSWHSSFLQNKPASQGSPFTVQSSTFIKRGEFYYALALVTSPPNGASMSDSNGVAVSAANDPNNTSARDGTCGPNNPSGSDSSSGPTAVTCTVQLYTPAVLLVHGLWGNASSLLSTEMYLVATGNYKISWVFPICYSIYLPWNAPVGSGASGECGQAPVDAIQSALPSAYLMYDSNHIAGGRVDVVAHSMGGLAARHYGGLSMYLQDYRSRNQGAIHYLVTVDTPAQGSMLANYLLEMAPRHVQTTVLRSPVARLVWSLAKCQSSWTAQQCFSTGMAMPLSDCPNPQNLIPAPVCDNLNTGPVYSLQPAVVNNDWEDPIIPPNAKWFAVVGSFPDTAPQTSVLRSVLQEIVKNLYPDGAPSPTAAWPNSLSSELGTQFNDVIVTTQSQDSGIGKSADLVYQPVVNLEHSPTPEVGQYASYINGQMSDDNVLKGQMSDDNVLNSMDVNQDILSALQQ